MSKGPRKVDPATLPDQFGGIKPGTTMILDGDSLCYVVAAKFKTVPTCIRHFQMQVLTLLFLTKAESAIVHLTASDSLKAGRHNIIAAKPYQGNRTGKAKPSLLEPVRQAVADESNWLPEYRVEYHRELEADDACMMDSYRLKDSGILVSDDKDLRATPYPYYERKQGKVMTAAGFGDIWPERTDGGTYKLEGQGIKFFHAQMLMGDAADNVTGLTKYKGGLVGPAKTFELLGKIEDESESMNFILDAYRENDQNPLPEGWLMWLLRWPGDNFWQYLQSLDLLDRNREFLNKCLERQWFITPT